MKILSYLVLIIAVVTGLAFAVLNPVIVTFDYYLGATDIALSLLLVFVFGGGMLLGSLLSIVPWFRLRRNNLRLKRHLKSVEQEVENLRSIPIKEKDNF
jgi:Predicted membrane protein